MINMIQAPVKNILLLLLLVILIGSVAEASTNHPQQRSEKEYKAKIKEYKRGKWEIFGSSRTLEVALRQHYDRLNFLGKDSREFVGIASRFKSKSIGHQQAILNACLTYAQQAASHLKGRLVTNLIADSTDPSQEYEVFYADYEQLIEKEIKGELSESYSIIRCLNTETGEYEMQTYFLVNENDAREARVRAVKRALSESGAPHHLAQQFIDLAKGEILTE